MQNNVATPITPLPALPAITPTHYAAAVEQLLAAAQHDTSGGRAAAQVLLGTYNCHAFHMDLVDLCLLDEENTAAAYTVLMGRSELRREPHTLVEDGNRRFQSLWSRWEHLHVKQRYARYYEEA